MSRCTRGQACVRRTEEFAAVKTQRDALLAAAKLARKALTHVTTPIDTIDRAFQAIDTAIANAECKP